MIVAVDVAPSRPWEQGDLSLALAGAELIDLLAAGAVTLDGTRVVPGHGATLPDDPLSDQAADSAVAEPPYESVTDWLWRRGRGLASVYLSALEADGRLTRRRRRWTPFRTGRPTPVDSLERHRARERWASHEPALAGLALAAGLDGQETPDPPSGTDDADDTVDTVLAAVHDAVTELRAVRQRRAIEQAAFDNVWRGG